MFGMSWYNVTSSVVMIFAPLFENNTTLCFMVPPYKKEFATLSRSKNKVPEKWYRILLVQLEPKSSSSLYVEFVSFLAKDKTPSWCYQLRMPQENLSRSWLFQLQTEFQ